MDKQIWCIILVLVLMFVVAGFQIKGAADCAAKGGTYITSKSSPSACVKEIK